MKRAITLVGASLVALVGFNAYAFTVGVVDIQKILGSGQGISKIQGQLESEFSGQRAKLNAMAKGLQADEANFAKNKAVMSQADVAKKEAALKSQGGQLQTLQAQYQQGVMKAQAAAMKNFIATVKTAAQEVAKTDKLDAVFIDNSLLYAKDSQDITSQVLSKMQ